MVIYPFGEGDFEFQQFDFLKDKPYCPICINEFVAVKPGFCNCIWRIVGIKSDGTSVSVPWRKALDNYTTYDEVKAGMAEYEALLIEAKPLEDSEESGGKILPKNKFCNLCLNSLTADSKILMCRHGFYPNCISEWGRPECPVCEAIL
jgi:hypothetical protein